MNFSTNEATDCGLPSDMPGIDSAIAMNKRLRIIHTTEYHTECSCPARACGWERARAAIARTLG
jgi:hypothetical protein